MPPINNPASYQNAGYHPYTRRTQPTSSNPSNPSHPSSSQRPRKSTPRLSASTLAFISSNELLASPLPVIIRNGGTRRYTLKCKPLPQTSPLPLGPMPRIHNPAMSDRIHRLQIPDRASGDHRIEIGSMDVRNNHSCAAKGDKILDWLIATELESNEREIEEDGGELEWKGGLVDDVRTRIAKNDTLKDVAIQCGLHVATNKNSISVHDSGTIVEAFIWAVRRQCSSDEVDTVAMVELRAWLGPLFRFMLLRGLEELAPPVELKLRLSEIDSVAGVVFATSKQSMADMEDQAAGAAEWVNDRAWAEGMSVSFEVEERMTTGGQFWTVTASMGRVRTDEVVCGNSIPLGLDIAAMQLLEAMGWEQDFMNDMN